MGFSYVLPSSLPFVVAAEAGRDMRPVHPPSPDPHAEALAREIEEAFDVVPVQITPADADRFTARLRGDYERWTRLLLGVVCVVVAVPALFLGVFWIGTLRLGAITPADLVTGAIFLVPAALAIVPLIRLWRSGRRLLRGVAHWHRLPYAAGVRSPDAAGWWRARTVNLEPRVLVRIVTSSLAALLGVCGIALLWFPLSEEIEGETIVALKVAAFTVGVLSSACAVGQMGGVMRLVGALADADPVWQRLRG